MLVIQLNVYHFYLEVLIFKSWYFILQPLWPPSVGSTPPQGFGSSFPMQVCYWTCFVQIFYLFPCKTVILSASRVCLISQFRPAVSTQQGQPFASSISASPQYRPIGQTPNAGMPPGHGQIPQFSQPMQQFPPRPSQPGHGILSSQAIQMPFIQSSMPQPQQVIPPLNSHMPGVSGAGNPFSSSYTVRNSTRFLELLAWPTFGFFILLVIIFSLHHLLLPMH